jgi:prolipoprotein diacylglyceryltransferase
MIIESSPPFDLIYIPVLILITGLFIFSGFRQRYPVSSIAAFTVFLMVLFVIGLKISSYPICDWLSVFSGSPVGILHNKYLPGGIIFVACGLALLRFILKIRLSILDSMILGLPFISILQRVDCLMSGCCYGKPTNLPWAIHYSGSSLAYRHQLAQGLIPETAVSSLGIHPTQFYYILGSLIVFLILFVYRKRIKSPGSLALLGILLLAVSRFVIEFYREPVQNKFSSTEWAGLNLLQLIILPLVLVSIFIFYQREIHYKSYDAEKGERKEYFWRSSLILFISALLVWNSSRILAYSEFFFLQSLIAFSVLVFLIRIFKNSIIPSARYPVLATLLLTIVIMSQKSRDMIIQPDSLFKPKTWWNVKASAGGGEYDIINYDCNGNETGRTKQQYSILNSGLEFNYMKNRNKNLKAGLNLGRLYDNGNLYWSMNDNRLIFLNPYFRYDFNKVGIGLGYNFFFNDGSKGVPSVYLRGGRRDNLFFDVNLMDNFNTIGLAGIGQIGVGTGLGRHDKHLLRVGLTSVEDQAVGYFEGNFLIGNRFRLQTALGLGNRVHGMIGMQYQISKARKLPDKIKPK